MNQRLEALISDKAKKLISYKLFIKIFYFKGTHVQQSSGCFPNHDWFCHPWPPYWGIMQKKVAKGDKTNHGWENTLKIVAHVCL